MINLVTKIKKILLFIGDIAILYFSLWLTLTIRYNQTAPNSLWQQHLTPFSLIFIVWLVVFYINNLYDLHLAKSNIAFYTTFFKSMLWCALLSVGFFYLFDVGIAPKTNLFINLIITTTFLSLWRHLFNKLAGIKALKSNVLILGWHESLPAWTAEINTKPQLGFKIVALVKQGQLDIDSNSPLTNDIDIVEQTNLKQTITDKKITTIVNITDLRQNSTLAQTLYDCLSMKIKIFDLPTFLEKINGKVFIDSIEHLWFLENFNEADKSIYEIGKRILDILIASIILILSIPFLPFIFVIVKLNSPGPFLFKQTRTGKNNKPFLAVKIRTMCQNAESSGPQWAQQNDPRVTRSGRLLRKTRIDEIPQLLNILRGEMSLIGPRPERPEFVASLSKNIPFYNQRHLVKPGLTGWAQINFPYGASEKDALEKLQYDLYYIKNRSLTLDLSIILKTIKTVLTGSGQ